MGSLPGNPLFGNQINTNLANRIIGTENRIGNADLDRDGVVTQKELGSSASIANSRLDAITDYQQRLIDSYAHISESGYMNSSINRWFMQQFNISSKIGSNLYKEAKSHEFIQNNFASIAGVDVDKSSASYRDITALVNRDGDASNLSLEDLNTTGAAPPQEALTPVVDNLPGRGASPDLKLIVPFMKSFSADDSYSPAELREAALNTQSPVYERAFNRLAQMSERFGKDITTTDLKALAGGGTDTVFNLNEIINLPEAANWLTPARSVSTKAVDIMYGNNATVNKNHFAKLAARHPNTNVRAAAKFMHDNYDALATADTDGDATTLSKASVLDTMKLAGNPKRLSRRDINAIVPTPTPGIQDNLPPSGSLDLIHLKPYLAQFGTNSSYNINELNQAKENTQSPVYKEAFRQLAALLAKQHNQQVTITDLETLALASGNDTVIDLAEISQLADQWGKTPPTTPGIEDNLPPSGSLDLIHLKPYLAQFGTNSSYNINELNQAKENTQSLVYKEAFRQLAALLAKQHNQQVTITDLETLALASGNDTVIDLAEISQLPDQWAKTPPATPAIQDNLPHGGSPNLIDIKPYMAQFSPDESYSVAELKKAAANTQSPMYQQVFKQLAKIAGDNKAEITATHLQTLAGTGNDTVFDVSELSKLPEILKPAEVSPPEEVSLPNSGPLDTSLISKQLAKFNTVNPGQYSYTELRKAAADAGNRGSDLYAKALNRLAMFADRHGDIKLSTLETLAKANGNDNLITLEELENLPPLLLDKPAIVDNLPHGGSPNLIDIKPYMAQFSPDESYSVAELKIAAMKTQSPMYQQVFTQLAKLAFDNGLEITATHLQTLAGTGNDTVFDVSELSKLPEILKPAENSST